MEIFINLFKKISLLQYSKYFICVTLFVYYLLGVEESNQLFFREIPVVSTNLNLDLAVSSSYFQIRRREIKSPISFKLVPVYYISNDDSYSQNRGEKNFLDHAFRLEYTIMTQQTLEGNESKYLFIYDDFLRLRDLVKKDSEGNDLLSLSFSEEGGLVAIREKIPKELDLEILFNSLGQIAVKTIATPKQTWQYRYFYRKGRLAKSLSLYNGFVVKNWIMSWKSGPEGREINRIDEFDIQGRKTFSWELERDLTLSRGEGQESVRQFTPQGKLIQETLRFWVGSKIREEYIFRNSLYHRVQYRYDENGLLKEKMVFDHAGKILAQHQYRYRLPENILNLVFLEQLKLNTLEITQYFLGSRLVKERKKFFHLQNLISQSEEEIVDEGVMVTRTSHLGGNKVVMTDKIDHTEKKMIHPLDETILLDRKIYYDEYGRIDQILFERFGEFFRKIKFFYKNNPKLALISDEGIFHRIERYYLGHNYWDHLYQRQQKLEKSKSKSLEQTFQDFFVANDSETEKNLLTQLKLLQATGLKKIIAYNRFGEIDHYYRIQQTNLSSGVYETRFTFFPKVPKLNLERTHYDILQFYSNNYTLGLTDISSAGNFSNYQYIGLGGWEEFHNQADDHINSHLEKPLETIVIRFRDHAILLDSRRILYNSLTGRVEREILIQGKELQTRIFE